MWLGRITMTLSTVSASISTVASSCQLGHCMSWYELLVMTFLSGSELMVVVWDATDCSVLQSIQHLTDGKLTCVAWLDDRIDFPLFVTGGQAGVLAFCKYLNRAVCTSSRPIVSYNWSHKFPLQMEYRRVLSNQAHSHQIQDIRYDRTTGRIATCSQGEVRIWTDVG